MLIKLQYYLLSFSLRALALLPLPILQSLGAIVGRLAYIFPNNLKKITAINIQLCLPELEGKRQTNLIKKSLIETGKTGFEMLALWSWPNQKIISLIQSVQGEALLKTALAQQKGIILLSPHLGAWEIINPYLAKNYPMVIMYKPAKKTYLDTFIYQARERSGSTLVPTNTTGVKALYRALQHGKVIGLLPDQDPGENGGEFAPFFNISTFTMSLVSRLALKTNAPVFLVYAERLKNAQGYKIHFEPTSVALADANPKIATTALNQELEKAIRKLPEQYQWGYRRFKQRPPGESKFY